MPASPTQEHHVSLENIGAHHLQILNGYQAPSYEPWHSCSAEETFTRSLKKSHNLCLAKTNPAKLNTKPHSLRMLNRVEEETLVSLALSMNPNNHRNEDNHATLGIPEVVTRSLPYLILACRFMALSTAKETVLDSYSPCKVTTILAPRANSVEHCSRA